MEFLTNIAAGVVIELVKYVVKPIRHQLGYIVFYNRNKKEFKEQLENLEIAKRDVDQRVQEARSNAYAIHEEVSKWLADVDNALLIHDEPSNSNPSCFNLLQRHQLSRKTKKRTTYILELIHTRPNSNFQDVGYRAPLPDTKNTTFPEGYQVLESKTSMAKQIKDALTKPEVKKVGIYGMGGVGKTYLLNEVKKLVLEDKLFDRVIDVSVGQSNDVMQMQQQIGDILHIELLQKTPQGRTSFLRNALVETKGNILITLDDLWEELDLIKEVGIPCSELGTERCKVLMTSRYPNILTNYMNTKECFEVTHLDKEESWKFFTKVIGKKFDTIDMEIVAKAVAKECGGLPLALDTIAKALKEKPINCWENALYKLKNSIAVDIKGVNKKVYASLRLSYDYLDGDESKLLFLLCSVFPDDYKIYAKDLQMYAMGMRLLKRVNTWHVARNSVIQLVDDLTSSSLLQLEDEYVKMHDIVRDVAIYIASTTTNMCTLNYGYTSSEELDEDKCGSYRAMFVGCKNFCDLLQNMKFPKLELLILEFSTWKYIEVIDAYFEGMENLKVLDLKHVHVPSLLWTSLKNLRTLCISDCECKDIDTIGHLKELEILRIIDCKSITELPVSMSELKQLKVLIVSNCTNLVVIHSNIISSMTKLEELIIQDCFSNWGGEVEYENTWIQNAQLSELNYLPHLSILSLQVLKANNVLLEDLSSRTLEKLREFCICVGTMKDFMSKIIKSSRKYYKYEKTLYFNMGSQIGSIDRTVCDIFLKETEQLMILSDSKGFTNVIFKAIGNGYPLLKCLAIDGNTEMQHLNGNDFSSLELLCLCTVMMLQSIVPKHAPTNPFNKLKLIQIHNCEQMKNLFSFSIFKGLSYLQEIHVTNCDMMDEIVSVEIEDHTTICTSPLTTLRLEGMNKLTSFCTKPFIQQNPQIMIPFFDQQVSFPKLEKLSICGGNNMEMLWHNNGPIGSSFSKLQSISITDCRKLKCMFPSNIVISLRFLESLEITCCELLERVFEIEKPISGDTKVVPLRYLRLDGLPNLKYLWNKHVGDVLAFPNLNEVKVTYCPKLKSVFPASFTKYFEQIERLKVVVQNEIFPVDEATKLVKVVSFQSLRTLRMTCKQATNGRFWVISKFLKLQRLKLVGCEDDDKMITRLPKEMNEVLYHVEHLIIKTCFQLEQVFGNEHTQSCANLKNLESSKLPKLTHVWKNINEMTTITFFNLVDLKVSGCGGMMNLFSSSVTKNLVNLSSIKIYDCRGMTSIVAAEEENGEIVFNKLTRLEFYKLPRLACFHSGKCTLKFPCLDGLSIDRCHDMKTFSYGITNTPTLQSIHIGGNEVLLLPTKGINAIIQAFFTQDQFEFLQSMTETGLSLSLKTVKRSCWHKLKSFPQLGSLTLIGSEDDDIVCLPLEMSEIILYNIERFEIENAPQLVQVFENEELLTGNNDVQRCAKLKYLYLSDLPMLTHVWKESTELTTISFDSLESICVRSCENLKCILPPSNSFLNLSGLSVDNCNGMMNLFNSSVVKNLENLNYIKISDCRGMTSIVAAVEEEENGEIIFKKLSLLRLNSLPRLSRFQSGKCMLKFPSLKTLNIVECNEMETFSVGIVSTPKLESMKIGGRDFRIWSARDINVIIQDIFTQRMQQVGEKQGEP